MPSDLIQFNPRERFAKSHQGQAASDYRVLMLRPDVQSAFVHAIAEMTRLGFSRDNLNGALAAIDLIQNFAEPAQKPVTMPVKSLPSQQQP